MCVPQRCALGKATPPSVIPAYMVALSELKTSWEERTKDGLLSQYYALKFFATHGKKKTQNNYDLKLKQNRLLDADKLHINWTENKSACIVMQISKQ